MISAQPNKPQQEKLIGKLMELPNNAVGHIGCVLRVWSLTGSVSLVGFFDGTSCSEHRRTEQYGEHKDSLERSED